MGNYVLLPRYGFMSDAMRELQHKAEEGSASIGRMSVGVAGGGAPGRRADADLEILDSVAEKGPKLVALEPERARRIRQRPGEFLLAPVRRYRKAVMPMRRVRTKGLFDGASSRTSVQVTVVEAGSGRPVEGATVIAVMDLDRNLGIRRRTGARGQATLSFPTRNTRLDELYIYPPHSVWGLYRRNVTVANGDRFALERIDFAHSSLMRAVYGDGDASDGQNVRVGVVDSGIDRDHPDLTIHGGANYAPDGPLDDFGAGADGHGTHVGGIVAGHGQAGASMRGVAPASELYSYRVFPKDGGSASNVEVAKAIHRAVQDGCHLINLSLGGGLADPTLNRAIGYAYARGVVCIAAAGNDGRRPVSYPAWYKRAVAVSAMGSVAHLPPDVNDRAEVEEPPSSLDPDLFIAGFSNIGDEIDATAPGVGVVSCFPGDRYAVMSGTSMAAPAVTGLAARLLSRDPGILAMQGGLDRARAIVEIVRDSARAAGFTPQLEGFGLPTDPSGPAPAVA